MPRNQQSALVEIQDCLDRLVLAQEFLLMAMEQYNDYRDDRTLNNRLHLLLWAFIDEWRTELPLLLEATAIARGRNLSEPDNPPPSA